jgi:hypothetical protein
MTRALFAEHRLTSNPEFEKVVERVRRNPGAIYHRNLKMGEPYEE